MSYLESDLILGDSCLTKRYPTEGIIEDVTAYFFDFYDNDKYMAVREALEAAINNNPNVKSAPFITYSAAMLLHQKKIYDASAGFLEFAFGEEIIGKPTIDDGGKPTDNKTSYAIAYLFALGYWRREVETKEEAEQRFFKDTLARKWEVVYEATCLVDLFKDRVSHHRFPTEDLNAASTLGGQFLARATM